MIPRSFGRGGNCALIGVELHPGPNDAHHDNRSRICALCNRYTPAPHSKKGVIDLSADSAYLVSVCEIIPNFDISDERLPRSLCSKCHWQIDRHSTGSIFKPNTLKLHQQIKENYGVITAKRQVIGPICSEGCLVCSVANSRGFRGAATVAPQITPTRSASAAAVAPAIHHKQLTHHNMLTIQEELGLSDRGTLRLASMLREMLDVPSVIAPNLKPVLKKKNVVLADLFDQCDFHDEPAVFCTDCCELLSRISAERRDDVASIEMVKVSVDSGGGFLKVSMNVLYKDGRNSPGRPRGRRYFRDSGVKTSFVLGMVPKVKETFAILSDLLRRVALPRKWILVGDLKVINIVLGLQPHGATFPCSYCNWRTGGADFSMQHLKHRTFSGIKRLSDAYKARFEDPAAKSSRAHLREYLGCEFGPIPGIFPRNGRVIDFIPLSELHLLLGIVNKLAAEFSLHKHCGAVSASWTQSLGVIFSDYRSEYNGNDCAALVSEHGVTLLHSLIQSATATVSGHLRSRARPRPVSAATLFYKAFLTFGRLVRGVFGAQLSPEWQDLIQDFRSAYLLLGVTITPKVHIIFVHLQEWIESHDESLGRFSEQAGEALHHDFQQRRADFAMRHKAWVEDPTMNQTQLRAARRDYEQWQRRCK